MSDEEEQPESAPASEPEAQEAPTSEATEPQERGTEPEAAAGPPPEGPAGRATASRAPESQEELEDALRGMIAEMPPERRNRWIPGTLTVHYRSRDVDFPMDGESALRLLAVLAGTSNDLDSVRRSSDARRVWVMVDRGDVLGARWTPDELTVPVAVTMDPGALVDAAR